jgi:hypothetical protein
MTTSLEYSNPLNPLSYIGLPLSGPVNQRIATSWFSPTFTVNYQGNAAVEERVVTEVASYGRQIGWLSELVEALATGKPPPPDTLAQFTKAMRRIQDIKEATKSSALEDAKEALERLRREAPKELDRLLRNEARRGPKAG